MKTSKNTPDAARVGSTGGSAPSDWTVIYVVCPTAKAADDVDAAIRKLSAAVGGPYIDLQTSYDGYRAELIALAPDLLKEVEWLQRICARAGISTLDGSPLPNIQSEPRGH